MIHTDEIEVLRTQQRGKPVEPRYAQEPRYPHPASERPRVFQRSLSDEDRTLLMPAKPKIASSRPPAPAPATPTSFRPQPEAGAKPQRPDMRGMMRPRIETERTIIRPNLPGLGPLSANNTSWTPKTEVHNKTESSKPPAMMPTPYVAFKPPVPPKLPTDVMRKSPPPPAPKVHEASVVMSVAKLGSDPKIDPPAAVITARTRVPPPENKKPAKRSNLTWAAALMAGGVFIGLITAVLARGDGDALVDATASFVDPSHNANAARQVATTVSTPVVNVTAKNATAKADTKKDSKEKDKEAAASCGGDLQPIAANTPAPKTEPAKVETPKAQKNDSVAMNDLVNVSRPEPPKPSPIAYAAPPQQVAQPVAAPPPRPVAVAAIAPVNQGAPLHPVAQPAPQPAPPPAPVVKKVVAQAPAPQPQPVAAAPAPKAAQPAKRDDFASAAAADALAKAQLEASLR